MAVRSPLTPRLWRGSVQLEGSDLSDTVHDGTTEVACDHQTSPPRIVFPRKRRPHSLRVFVQLLGPDQNLARFRPIRRPENPGFVELIDDTGRATIANA